MRVFETHNIKDFYGLVCVKHRILGQFLSHGANKVGARRRRIGIRIIMALKIGIKYCVNNARPCLRICFKQENIVVWNTKYATKLDVGAFQVNVYKVHIEIMHGFVDEYLEPFFGAIYDDFAVCLAVSRETRIRVDRRDNRIVAGRSLFLKRCHIKIHIKAIFRAFFIRQPRNNKKPDEYFIRVKLVDCDFRRAYIRARVRIPALSPVFLTDRNMRLGECYEKERNRASVNIGLEPYTVL